MATGISDGVYATSSHIRGRCVLEGLIVLDLVRVSVLCTVYCVQCTEYSVLCTV